MLCWFAIPAAAQTAADPANAMTQHDELGDVEQPRSRRRSSGGTGPQRQSSSGMPATASHASPRLAMVDAAMPSVSRVRSSSSGSAREGVASSSKASSSTTPTANNRLTMSQSGTADASPQSTIGVAPEVASSARTLISDEPNQYPASSYATGMLMTASSPSPVPPSQFYRRSSGQSSSGQRRFIDSQTVPIEDVQVEHYPQRRSSLPRVGLDLDADDDIPEESDTESSSTYHAKPVLHPPGYNRSSSSQRRSSGDDVVHVRSTPANGGRGARIKGLPAEDTDLTGHGWLQYALTGASQNPAFTLEAVLQWNGPETSGSASKFPSGIVAVDIIESFEAQKPISGTKSALPATPASAQVSQSSNSSQSPTIINAQANLASSATQSETSQAPPKIFSYSQALNTARPMSMPQSSIGSAPQSSTSSQVSAATSATPDTPVTAYIKSARELKMHVPHPHALYDSRRHAWLLMTPIPSLNNSNVNFDKTSDRCPGDSSRKMESRLAHHYIRRSQCVDPKYILRTSSVQRPGLDGFAGPSVEPWVEPGNSTDPCWSVPTTPREYWLDAMICDGCRRAIAVTPLHNAIPSVLGYDVCSRFQSERMAELLAIRRAGGSHSLNSTFSEARDVQMDFREAVDYIWKVLRNLLFNGNSAHIPRSGATFTKRMGTGQSALDIFKQLGFRSILGTDKKEVLAPPVMTESVILVLTRAFLEISIWCAKLISDLAVSDTGIANINNHQNPSQLVSLSPAIDLAQNLFGKSPAFAPPHDTWSNDNVFNRAYAILGIVPETSNEGLVFAYNAQIASDPQRLHFYLESLKEVRQARSGSDALPLDIVMATEDSQNRLTYSDICSLWTAAGHPPRQRTDLPLFFGMPEIDLPSEDQSLDGYNRRMEEIGLSSDTTSEKEQQKNSAREALRKICQIQKSELLQAVLLSADDDKPPAPSFTEEEALKLLCVQKDTDDASIGLACTVYLAENANDKRYTEKIVAAIKVVAEARNSNALRTLAETGIMPEPAGPQEAAVSSNMPAGLQNIGNTCYLNSLLQYFFTIRELREVVLRFEEYKEADTPTESKRVGGRQLSHTEIARSKKFVSHLSSLFSQLIHTPTPSVRPEKELAYLALVSSKDEEDQNASNPAQDTAAVSDQKSEAATELATIDVAEPESFMDVSEGLTMSQKPEDAPSPSVLGKRNSDHLANGDMDVDDGQMPRKLPSQSPIKNDRLTAQEAEDGVMEIIPESQAIASTSARPPPLPPRPSARRESTLVNTNMMFGRQNDVSEAMDNVIFQIEAGLKDSLIPKSETSGRTFVQQLFCGTSRQVLNLEAGSPGQKARVKDELFSYLLVDVANEGTDLYDGLDAAFEPSTVEVEGHSAVRQDVLTHLPPVLQIQLQRVQFDRATARVFKSNAFMPFPLSLQMARYIDYDPQDSRTSERHQRSKTLRATLKSARERLLQLSQANEDTMTASQVLREAAACLNQIGTSDPGVQRSEAFQQMITSQIGDKLGNTHLIEGILSQAQAIEDDVANLKHNVESFRREMHDLWEDERQHDYELSSVFIHQGAAGYGHYYLYQRALPSQPDRWLKFNDSTVTEVPVSEVFADTTGQTANPYWLSYIRKTDVMTRIDAVHRIL